MKCRSKTENKAREDGQSTRERQHSPIHLHISEARCIRGQNELEQGQPFLCKKQPERSPQYRLQHTLSEKLSGDPHPSGA